MSYDSLSLAEHHIYGSSRLGLQQYSDTAYLSVYKEGELLENALSTRQPWYSYTYNDWILPTATKPISTTGLLSRCTSDIRSLRILGYRQYELTNHLGNATATILDRRTGYGDAAGYYTGYHADLVSALDYYPFGMPMPGRSVDSYRFGLNGIEKVNEVAGIGNHYTALYGEYDPRTGKRWNIDPKPNISLSSYSLYANNPIRFSDPLLDTIIAEKSAQTDIKSDLKSVYKKDLFEFNSNDELNFNAEGLNELNSSLRSYSGKNKKKLAMKESLLGMETMINCTEMTGIKYSDAPISINAIDPGTSNTIPNPKPSQLGGEFALTKQDLTGTTYSFSLMGRKLDNIVNVNPAPSTTQYVNATLLKNPTSAQLLQGVVPFVNPRHSLLMHGLGHVLYQGASQQPDVIKFDNANRTLSGDSHNDDPTGTHK